jgi:hypothetical protein
MEILKTPPAFCLSKIRNSLQIFESSTPKTSTRDVFSAQDDTDGGRRHAAGRKAPPYILKNFKKYAKILSAKQGALRLIR